MIASQSLTQTYDMFFDLSKRFSDYVPFTIQQRLTGLSKCVEYGPYLPEHNHAMPPLAKHIWEYESKNFRSSEEGQDFRALAQEKFLQEWSGFVEALGRSLGDR